MYKRSAETQELIRVLRVFIHQTTGIPLDKIIQATTTGAKPKEIFATVDVLNNYNSTSDVTNNYYDEETQEMVYETHKRVFVVISIRNGNPNNQESQQVVGKLCERLYEMMKTVNVTEFIFSNSGFTTVLSDPIRSISDSLPTGFGKVAIFNSIFSYCYVVRVREDIVESVELNFSLLDGEKELRNETIVGEFVAPRCSGFDLTPTLVNDVNHAKDSSNHFFSNFFRSGVGTFTSSQQVDLKDVHFEIGFRGVVKDASVNLNFNSSNLTISNGVTAAEVFLDGVSVMTLPREDNLTVGICLKEDSLILATDLGVFSLSTILPNQLSDVKVTLSPDARVNLIFDRLDFRFSIPDSKDICGFDLEG